MDVQPRRVSAHLVMQVRGAAELVLQVAVAGSPTARAGEQLTIEQDGAPVPATEIAMGHSGRAHLLRLGPGQLTVGYHAAVGSVTPPAGPAESERIIFLRPSRYAESDRLAAVARSEFAGIEASPQLLAAVSSWVGTRLSYVPGSSRPTDGAVQTLLQRQGVCRDYAHLVIALLRALDVPARLAAVYAPGLDPMDFHAVAEAMVGGQWCVVDATLLAPRASLVRIATGRDAADTAFLSAYGAPVELTEIEVSAVTDGPLPGEDVTALVSIG